ncbi:DUF3263 domain-containing protein [Williamsia deligens]|uniref:DUF3263 domain-containing protein n=1 Tax=Williamsia deligens TaxID=321325 RepID=A0ABW3GB92_9NOCA|nr:DUF3263 domain-containing protein [Williamsia deligens]
MTDDDRALLAFEKQWWRTPGAKENAIREQFGISTTRYYQRLTRILDNPEALADDPVLVRRLQRIRDARAVRRAS